MTTSPFDLHVTPDAVHLSLRGAVTIVCARALYDALRPALTTPRPLRFTAAELTRIDAAGLQIVLAALRAAPTAEPEALAPAWTDALTRHGLADPFGHLLKPTPRHA